jgi:hypothetical protein
MSAYCLSGKIGQGEKPGLLIAIEAGELVPQSAVNHALMQYRLHEQVARAQALLDAISKIGRMMP